MPDPQQATPAPQQTLAQLVKSKYPGAYDDMADTDLEQSVLAKHPEYSDLPRTPTGKNIASESSMAANPPKPAPWQMKPMWTPSEGLRSMNQPLPRPPGGGEENTLAEGAGPGLAGLSTIGMAGVPIEAALTKSLAPFIPAARAMVGGLAGQYAGQKVGGLVGHPEAGGKVGGLVGGIAGGMGKLPNRASLEESLFSKPELGSPENPDFHSKLPARLPMNLRGDPFAPKPELPAPTAGAQATGSASKPFEPLVYESPQEAEQIDFRNQNLKRQASSAGTYHAAQGAAGKRTNLQQRIQKKALPWESQQ